MGACDIAEASSLAEGSERSTGRDLSLGFEPCSQACNKPESHEICLSEGISHVSTAHD